MSGESRVISRPLWRARWSARAPKAAFAVVVALLSIAGLRAVLAGQRQVAYPAPAQPARDLSAEGFAEAFVRTYLTWDPAHPERRERQVSMFTSDRLESGAGLSAPSREAQQVVWTAVIRDEAVSSARHLITVAAETTNSPYFVSVPVQRDPRGQMAVSRYPALVGAPPVDTKARPGDEPEVEEQDLRTVARRAISNYLRGEAANLRADLDTHAVVTLPATPLKLSSVDSFTWVRPARRVALEVQAAGRGTTWTLRYELGVVKRERWYVRSIQSDATARGSS
jgi:hypothetical protein